MLKKVIVGKVDEDLLAKYTVLSGAFCILKYIENCQSSNFPPLSVRSVFRQGVALPPIQQFH